MNLKLTMNKLKKQLDILASHISNQAISNPEISSSDVGWHVEHILLTMNAVITAAKESNPENYKWSFKFLKLVVFTLKSIPRGRAKAPQVVAPKTYNEESLNKHLKIAHTNLEDLKNLPSNKYFSHPFFGDLKLNKTLEFLEIHNNHHLKIIDDILKSKS